MTTINLFESCSGFQALKDIYRLSDPVIAQIMKRCIRRDGVFFSVPDDCVLVFLQETGIHPDTFDLSDVMIHCKHITTAFDNGESFLKYGLTPTVFLLERDTDLRRFLLDNEIEISDGVLHYKKFRWSLPKDCSGVLGIISAKLFHDKGEVEVFVSGYEEDLLNYSTVKDYPEILYTIDDAIKELAGVDIDLGRIWKEKKPKTYLLEFDVGINNLSYLNGLLSRWESPSAFAELEDYLEVGDSQLLWQNEWVIKECINNGCPGFKPMEKMAGIKNVFKVTGDMIKIKEIADKSISV